MAVLLVLSCFVSSLGTGSETNSSNNGFFFLFSLFLGIVLAISGVYYAIKGDRNQREQEIEVLNRVQSLEREKAAQENEVNQQRAHLQQVLWSRYDQIYYCHRDDLLFIPGKSDFASCDEFEGYLTYILETN